MGRADAAAHWVNGEAHRTPRPARSSFLGVDGDADRVRWSGDFCGHAGVCRPGRGVARELLERRHTGGGTRGGLPGGVLDRRARLHAASAGDLPSADRDVVVVHPVVDGHLPSVRRPGPDLLVDSQLDDGWRDVGRRAFVSPRRAALVCDRLGTVRLATDTNGDPVGTATYDEYGQPTATTGDTSTYGYAGQYTDPETGYQYLRARYYDPTTAEFLTRDPLETLTREPYQYAANTPTNATDPTGEAAVALVALAPYVLATVAIWLATPQGQQACRQAAVAIGERWNGILESRIAPSDDSNEAEDGSTRSTHAALKGGEGDRNIDSNEVRQNGRQYYDQDGNQVYVEDLPGGKSNVTIVNPSTGLEITTYPAPTDNIEKRIANGDLWSLNE